jgi:N-acetylglucosamine-6-sulfatase
LFIFSDDHAQQAIGAYGSTINKTPNIDRIGRQGMVFVNSFCANSICGPSRACILTGKHSHLNGFLRNGNRFDGQQDTFTKRLQRAGYQTALIGKWHLESDPVGFDHWQVLPGQGHYYNPDLIQMDGSRKRLSGYCTDLITDLSLQWLRERRDSARPFLLMCQHKAPHRNWAPAARHLRLFRDERLPEPATLFDDYAGRSTLLRESEMSIRQHFYWSHDMKFHGENRFPRQFLSGQPNEEYERMDAAQRAAWDAHYEPENQMFIQQMESGELDEQAIVRWKYQRYIKDYLRCVTAVDESVGRMLAYLDESGLSANTMVVYASDQGFYLGEHGWYDKRWMFEESLRMPLLIRWPGVVAEHSRCEALVQNIDYAPTFLEAAGVEVPPEIQGRSLIPILRQAGKAPAAWRDSIYYAFYENAAVHQVPVHDGIRTGRYKLIFFPRNREWQLFDLKQDPNELHSRHDDPEFASIMTGLKQRYKDLRRLYDVNSATIPTTRGDEAWWRERQQTVDQRARQGEVDLLFLGDSITQGWEEEGHAVWQEYYARRRPLNLGFSGDRTEHLLWRLDHTALDSIQPRVTVLMIGTNNTGHAMQDAAEVAAGVERILERIEQRLPRTQVVLLGLFPRGTEPFDPMRLNNLAINDRLRRLGATRARVHYLDLSDAFLEPDGHISPQVMPDALHLSADGYRRWAEALEPTLRTLGL